MFYKYEIKNINNEEVLYLYLSLKYEFANEFIEDSSLKYLTDEYLKMNNINFHGNKIYLVVDGIVIKKLNVANSTSINKNYLPDNFLINLVLDDNSLCEINIREYLLGILFLYYNNELGDEVLKSICVLYNSYAYKMMIENNCINASNDFNNYIYYTQYRNKYNNFDSLIRRFNNIINSVAGIYLSFNNQYILPFIHLSNGGKTFTNIKYPYLNSVNSLWDLSSPNYINTKYFKYDDISNLLKTEINCNTNVNISFDNDIIKFGRKKFSLLELKVLLDLNSIDINIIMNKDTICFITKGIGNSLGLSLYGANFIENNGGKFNNILNYYFPNTILCKHIKELSK